MTDLRALLHASAPAPSRDVDVDAILSQAARRRPWRRIAVWFGSMAVVFGVGAGSTGMLNPAGDDTAVDTRPSPQPTDVVIGDVDGSVQLEVVRTARDVGAREPAARPRRRHRRGTPTSPGRHRRMAARRARVATSSPGAPASSPHDR